MVKILNQKKTKTTDPEKKEIHKERKVKKAILHSLEEKDWKEKVKEYNANKQI